MDLTNCYKLKKYFWMIVVWFIPPLLPFIFHWFTLGYMEIIPICPQCYSIKDLSGSTTPQASSLTSIDSSVTKGLVNQLVSNKEQNKAFDDLGRFLPIVNVPTALVRYNLFVQNDVSIDVAYIDSTDAVSPKHSTFNSVLSCQGKTISFGITNRTVLARQLYLSEKTSDDREYVKEIVSSCITNPMLSALNDTGQTLRVQSANLSPSSTISFIVSPDEKSQIFMIIGWYLVWFGFLILVREGPLKNILRAKD